MCLPCSLWGMHSHGPSKRSLLLMDNSPWGPKTVVLFGVLGDTLQASHGG